MKNLEKVYGTSQEILYTICLSAWDLCSQHLTKFASLKGYYTADFILAEKEAVQNAKELPSTVQTVSGRKAARINMQAATRQVQADWQLLKLYIVKAYNKSMINIKLEAAGATFYAKASVDNWSCVRSLIEQANNFILANLEELTANDNMPAAFQTTFQNAGEECTELSTIFFGLNLKKQVATSNKINANNNIYARVIEMMKDGQQIFRDNSDAKKQFTFSQLVSVYKSEGSASLRGRISNNVNFPLHGVAIISIDKKYSATTDAKGGYRINRIAEGGYTFSVTCPGYAPVKQVIHFTAGTASKADFELVSAMKDVA